MGAVRRRSHAKVLPERQRAMDRRDRRAGLLDGRTLTYRAFLIAFLTLASSVPFFAIVNAPQEAPESRHITRSAPQKHKRGLVLLLKAKVHILREGGWLTY
jgi:hypothetical protein